MSDFPTYKEHLKEVLFRPGEELLTDPEAFQTQMVTALEEWKLKDALSEELVEGFILR